MIGAATWKFKIGVLVVKARTSDIGYVRIELMSVHFDTQESITGFTFGSTGADVVFAPETQYQTDTFIIKVKPNYVGYITFKTIYPVVLGFVVDLYVYSGQFSEKRYGKIVWVMPYVIGIKLDFVV